MLEPLWRLSSPHCKVGSGKSVGWLIERHRQRTACHGSCDHKSRPAKQAVHMQPPHLHKAAQASHMGMRLPHADVGQPLHEVAASQDARLQVQASCCQVDAIPSDTVPGR